MRIIKNNSLTSNFPINTISISFDNLVIAYGDGNKNITVISNGRLIEYHKSKKGQKEANASSNNINSKFTILAADPNLNKIELAYHSDAVNALVFAKRYHYNLISGSSDKSIIIWYLNKDLSQNKKRLLTTNSEVTDLQLSLNDQFLFSSFMDNSIGIYYTHFQDNGNPELISVINVHNNIVTSLALDNFTFENQMNKINLRCASYADDGRLIISDSFADKNGLKTNVLKDFKEFVNANYKNGSIQKKIDWSVDGNWIAAVNYHYIKNHKVYHVKLIDMKGGNSEILIGHEAPVLVAKFSICKYTDKNGKSFNILATGDKSGNLILWKICGNSFKALAEINNLSESNITNICWSPFGDYLYVSNSNGTIYIIELNDFSQIEPSSYHLEISRLLQSANNPNVPNQSVPNTAAGNQNVNLMNNLQKEQLKIIFSPNINDNVNNNSNNLGNMINTYNMLENNIYNNDKKKKIVPQNVDDMMNPAKKVHNYNGYNVNYNNNNNNNNNNNQSNASNNGNFIFGNYINDMQNPGHNHNNSNYMNNIMGPENKHVQENDNCNLCKVLKFDSIQSKEANIKLDLADDFNASFIWENKINSYSSSIKFVINNKILFNNYLNGKFIKHFVCNNFVYVYYDTNNLIHISSLFNTNILNNLHYDDVSYIRLFGNFVLIVSAGNKFTIVNAFTKRKMMDEFIDIKLDSFSTISDVKYFDIDKIFVVLSQWNQIKKSFVKQIFLFNTEYKLLMKIDDNQEIDQMINTKIVENNKIKSIYSDILLQNNLIQPLFENLLSIDCSEEDLKHRIKLTDEIKEFEEKLSFFRLLGQKEDFFKILRNYMMYLVKHKIYYKIIDLTMDILRLNSEFYLYIKDETDILIANLLKEIFVEDPTVNMEIKNYVICLAQEN